MFIYSASMFLSEENTTIEIINDEIAVETILDEYGNGNRYYFYMKSPKKKYVSVTTLTKWANPGKVISINAYTASKTPEEQEALKETWKQTRERGKRVHKALEKNNVNVLTDKKDIAYFSSYSKYINNIVLNTHKVEETSFWSGDINGIQCSYAGTADALHQVAQYNLIHQDGEPLSELTRNCVIDYKNPKKNHLNYHPEYGLEYYLQLAANTAALNQKTNDVYKCRDSLLIVATQRTINIYYLPNESLAFYWSWFKRLLYNYTTNKLMSFDDRCAVWNQFAEEAVEHYPYNVKIKQQNDFNTTLNNEILQLKQQVQQLENK